MRFGTFGKVNCNYFLFMVFLATLPSIHAQDYNLNLVSRWTYGSCNAVKIQDEKLFIGNGATLQCYDISDHENPSLISELSLSNAIAGIHIDSTVAFVTLESDILEIIDFSDSENPVSISNYNSSSSLNAVRTSGNIAYLLERKLLRTLDISDINNPKSLSELSFEGDAQDFRIRDGYAFIANRTLGLQIVNVADPENMQLISNLEVGGLLNAVSDVEIKGDFAFLATSNEGLMVVNITDLSNPEVVTNIDPAIAAKKLRIAGDIIYMLHDTKFLFSIDISDPTSPQKLEEYIFDGAGKYLEIKDNLLVMANVADGVHALDISDSENFVDVFHLESPGSTSGVLRHENNLFVLAGDVHILDISDPENPISFGNIETGRFAEGIVIRDDHMFLANGSDGLEIYDISNLSEPQKVGQFRTDTFGSGNTTGTAKEVKLQGDIAYVAGGYEGVFIVDISNLSNPTLKSRVEPLHAWELELEGDYIYTTGFIDGLKIIDIKDPNNPKMFEYPEKVGGEGAIFVKDNKVYAQQGGLAIYDVSDPSQPNELGYLNQWGIASIQVAEERAYLARGNSGLMMLDVSDPTDQVVLAQAETFGLAVELFLSEDYIYVANSNSGVAIFKSELIPSHVEIENPIPSEFSLQQNYPNPFNPYTTISYTIAKPSFVKIAVFDKLGRQVAELVNGFKNVGKHFITFDATDLPSGTYIYRLKIGRQTEWKKMTLIK